MKPLLVVIGGPTGVGKTAAAINLAKLFNTEIISADSRQIYKEMTIGTAVPSPEELKSVRHHLVQTRSIKESYSAFQFEVDALQLLVHLFKRLNPVIMVGGSGLYIDALCRGIDDLPSIPTEVRQKYAEFYKQNGIEAIRTKVREIDPVYYQTVDRNNPNRMLKALEVFDITGKPYSSFLNYSTKERSFAILKIMLDVERTALYNRINNRVDQMVKSGLEAEARQLIPFRHVNPLKTVGYKEFFDYFEGKISYDEAVTQIKNHSRAYARRQLTWFRRYTEAQWFSPDDTKEMYNLILNTLN